MKKIIILFAATFSAGMLHAQNRTDSAKPLQVQPIQQTAPVSSPPVNNAPQTPPLTNPINNPTNNQTNPPAYNMPVIPPTFNHPVIFPPPQRTVAPLIIKPKPAGLDTLPGTKRDG